MAQLPDDEIQRNNYDSGVNKKITPLGDLDSKLHDKKEKKLEQLKKVEDEIAAWIETKLNIQKDENLTFQKWLESGYILCELANQLKPNSCKKYKDSKVAAVCMNNIQIFVHALKQDFGFKDHDTFNSNDLYGGNDLVQVIQCLDLLKRKYQ